MPDRARQRGKGDGHAKGDEEVRMCQLDYLGMA